MSSPAATDANIPEVRRNTDPMNKQGTEAIEYFFKKLNLIQNLLPILHSLVTAGTFNFFTEFLRDVQLRFGAEYEAAGAVEPSREFFSKLAPHRIETACVWNRLSFD